MMNTQQSGLGSTAKNSFSYIQSNLLAYALAFLSAIVLLFAAASPAQAQRASLSGIQQEIRDLRGTVCGNGASQADCDAAADSAVLDKVSDLERRTSSLVDAICDLHRGELTFDVEDELGCSVEGRLRLVGGNTDDEGRLEVQRADGVWGTVCDDRFDSIDAGVACRQLGYSDGTPVFFLTDQPGFERGNGPIFLDDLNCTGTEERLIDCPHRGIGLHNCSSFEDVGVSCSN